MILHLTFYISHFTSHVLHLTIMKKYLMPSLKLTLVLIVLLAVIYPLFIAAVGKLTLGSGDGETVKVNGKVVGYALIGQKFTDDKYFCGRPSAVDYNAAGSA